MGKNIFRSARPFNNLDVLLGFIVACCTMSVAWAEDSASNSELPLPAVDEWAFMSFEQRHSTMTFLIHPTMMERFQEFYQTKAPTLTCVSCHGENPERTGYDLANSTITALEPERVRALYQAGAKLTAEQSFKRDQITPTMARLLGVPKYDPKTGLGFSCFGCHRRE